VCSSGEEDRKGYAPLLTSSERRASVPNVRGKTEEIG